MEEVTNLKIGLLVAMGVFATIFGFLPIRLRSLKALSSDKSYPLSLITCFAGGVFLAVCILDILPEAFEMLEEIESKNVTNSSIPWVGMLTGLGFFLVHFIEIITDHCCAHSHQPSEEKLTKVLPRISSGLDLDSDRETSKNSEEISFQTTKSKDLNALSKCLSLVFALSIHSALEGFAFGIQMEMKSTIALFFGIMIHKAAVFFSTGVRLSTSNLSPALPIIFVFFLSAMAPFGGFVGLLIEGVEIPAKDKIMFFLNCLSLGTFLQITFYELLVPESQKGFSKIGQFAATLVEVAGDKITVAGRIFCNSSYVTGDAYIELNDFDGILEPDFIGETIVQLENEPNKRKVFRISGEASDGSINPRLEPYLRIFHGCGVNFRTECLQLIPEEAPSEDYFYYMGDIILNGDEEVKVWESCQPKYCRPMTKWQLHFDQENLDLRIDVSLRTANGQQTIHEMSTTNGLADWIAPLLAQRDTSETKSGNRRCRPVMVVPASRPFRMIPPPMLPFSIRAHHQSAPRQAPHPATPYLPPNQSSMHRVLNQQQHPPGLHPTLIGHSLEHQKIPGVKWIHSVGKTRRMYVSAGVSTFAEVMRPWVEKHCSHTFTSFSEVVSRALPFWDTLTRVEREAWQERAVKEGKQDHCIYMRSPNWEQQANQHKHRRHEEHDELDENDSDPDELPGPLVEGQEHGTQHSTMKILRNEKSEVYSNDVRQCPIRISATSHLFASNGARISSNSSSKADNSSSTIKANKASTALVWERGHVSTHPHAQNYRHPMHYPHQHTHPHHYHHQHNRGGSTTMQRIGWSTEKRKPQPFEGRNWIMGRYTSSTRTG
ncbi:unnamed protein product, partial [Mesorhabditis belari]|uniref:Uncharacterized protein n=1 Tax=Mesorhabditis belari TaxID=2138241 RepID=A0AAF3ETR7_9BILA